MELDNANEMLTFLIFVIMFSFIGALCYITKPNFVVTYWQPIVPPPNCPPITRQRNEKSHSINHTACTDNQRRRPAQENDDRLSQTVGVVKKTKLNCRWAQIYFHAY